MNLRSLVPVLVLLAVAVPACGQPMDFAASVVVADVTRVAMPQQVSLFGTVEPFRRSRVAAETEGRVEGFPFVEGATVSEGCVVAKVRTRTLEIEKEASIASLAEASAELKRLQNGYRREEIEAARARVAALQQLTVDAEKDFERTSSLLPEGAVSKEEFDKAKILFAAATARLVEASANLEMMVEGFRAEEIAKAAAQLEARRAELARIEEEIAKASVRVPFTGFIAETSTELGEWLGVGDPVIELIQMDPALVRVEVPERYLRGVTVGRIAVVTLDALPGYQGEGEITRIVPEADVSARTFPIKIQLANPEHLLLAGMLARVTLEVGEPRTVTAVPKDAIVLSNRGNAVFIVNEGKARMVPVQVGDSYNNLVAIEGNVEVGVPVVIRGNERLRDGQRVNIETAATPGPGEVPSAAG